MRLAFTVYLEREDGGVWSALCVELPGCISQGTTEHEAMENIVEAIELNVEYLQSQGRPIPSAKVDNLDGAFAVADLRDEEIRARYPHLDAGLIKNAEKRTLLVA